MSGSIPPPSDSLRRAREAHGALFAKLPNALSLSRIALTVPIFLLIALGSAHQQWIALALFALAAATDFADGYLARALNARTVLGSHLDPIADKVLVIGTLGALAANGHLTQLAQAAFAFIFAREAVVGLARLARASAGTELRAHRLSKLKTIAQLAGTGVILASTALRSGIQLNDWGSAILAVAAALGLLSLIDFLPPRQRPL